MVDSVDDLMSSSSTRGIQMPNFEVLDARIASALNRIIHNSHFKRRISLEEQKGPEAGPFPSRKTDCLPDLRLLPGHWEPTILSRIIPNNINRRLSQACHLLCDGPKRAAQFRSCSASKAATTALLVATRAAVDRCGPGHVPTPLSPTGTEEGRDRGGGSRGAFHSEGADASSSPGGKHCVLHVRR